MFGSEVRVNEQQGGVLYLKKLANQSLFSPSSKDFRSPPRSLQTVHYTTSVCLCLKNRNENWANEVSISYTSYTTLGLKAH